MIQSIDLQADNVVAYRIDGAITADEIKPLASLLDEKVKKHGKMRVYAEYIAIDSITPGSLWESLKLDFAHLTDFEKAAIVTDKNWVSLSAGLANLIPGLDVKFFRFSEQDQARQWIKS